MVELLVEGNAKATDLLNRMLPASLVATLAEPWQEPATASLKARGGGGSRPEAKRSLHNWPLFFQRLRGETASAELIWNGARP